MPTDRRKEKQHWQMKNWRKKKDKKKKTILFFRCFSRKTYFWTRHGCEDFFFFHLFFSPSSLKSVGPRRISDMVAKWREITKKEVNCRAVKALVLTLSLYQSKYHCYIANCYDRISRLGVWNCWTVLFTRRLRRGTIAISFFSELFLISLVSTGGPANLCDGVVTECLPAAECRTLQQTSPLLARSCLPADPHRPPPHHPRPPSGLQAKSSSFRTGPTCVEFFFYYCCSRVCPRQPPLPLSLLFSPAKITLAEQGGTWCVFVCLFFFLEFDL